MVGGRTTGLAAVKQPEPHKPNPTDTSMTGLSLFARFAAEATTLRRALAETGRP